MRKISKLTLPSSDCNDPGIGGSCHRGKGNDMRVEAVHCQIVVGRVNCHQWGCRPVRKLHINVKQPLLKNVVFENATQKLCAS